jgi:flagellin-specific chaperone FliS
VGTPEQVSKLLNSPLVGNVQCNSVRGTKATVSLKSQYYCNLEVVVSKKQEKPTTLWDVISDDSRRALVRAHQVATARQKFAKASANLEKASNKVTPLQSALDEKFFGITR